MLTDLHHNLPSRHWIHSLLRGAQTHASLLLRTTVHGQFCKYCDGSNCPCTRSHMWLWNVACNTWKRKMHFTTVQSNAGPLVFSTCTACRWDSSRPTVLSNNQRPVVLTFPEKQAKLSRLGKKHDPHLLPGKTSWCVTAVSWKLCSSYVHKSMRHIGAHPKLTLTK